MIKLLDCTIRDGGHLNGWNYSNECVRASYFAAIKAGVDYFEIGYRFQKPQPGWGNFARCEDEFLFSLFKPNENCKLAIMIDAGKSCLDDFKECKPELTPIKLVRVATYSHNLDIAFELCEGLLNKGYEVFLNLMAISEYKEKDFTKIKNWKSKNKILSICFADSFGSFIPDDISKYHKKLKEIGFKNISFHSHNNLQLAFANSIKAVEEGFYCIDASIYGMGRGSGNLPAEVITGYLSKIGNSKYNPVAYIDVIERFYLNLAKETPWGYRIQSLIGGLKNIHPYYVNSLYEKKSFTINEIWTAADLVKKFAPVSYDTDNLNAILSDKFVNYDDIKIKEKFTILPEEDAFLQNHIEFKNIFKNRTFLIIANGTSIKDKQEEIKNFIKSKNCVVIGTNFLDNLYKPDFHCFVNKKRFLKYVNSINKNEILLLPSFFGKKLVSENTNNKVKYFDVEIDSTLEKLDEIIDVHKYQHLNVAISAIYCAYQMGAKEIYATGLDGFGANAEKLEFFYKEDDIYSNKSELMKAYKELANSLDLINKFLESKSIPFSIITKTSHDKYYSDILEQDAITI